MVYIQCRLNCIFAALRVVVQAIDHGAVRVAVLQHGPTVGVLHVRPHPDAEQEHHAPVPANFQCDVELQMLHWKVSARLPFVFLLLDPQYR